MSTMQNLILFIWFYIGWFGCVFFSKWNLSVWSLVFALPPLLYFLFFQIISKRQFLLLLLLAFIGVVFDSIAYFFNLIHFTNHDLKIIPLWLVSMWLLFISVFPISHKIFNSKKTLASIVGMIAGPLSYYSGEAFEVLFFNTQITIIIYAVFWAFYFPIAHIIYRKYS